MAFPVGIEAQMSEIRSLRSLQMWYPPSEARLYVSAIFQYGDWALCQK
jgi:hypothetical protein